MKNKELEGCTCSGNCTCKSESKKINTKCDCNCHVQRCGKCNCTDDGVRYYRTMPNSNEEMWKSFEPKMNNRFVVTIGDPWDIPKWAVKSITRPLVNIDSSVLSELILELYDPITPSTSQAVWEGLRSIKTERIVTDLKLEMMGPAGDIVSVWNFTGQFTMFEFSKLDWEDDAPATIIAKFRVESSVHEY